jgi:hypothetical protein
MEHNRMHTTKILYYDMFKSYLFYGNKIKGESL